MKPQSDQGNNSMLKLCSTIISHARMLDGLSTVSHRTVLTSDLAFRPLDKVNTLLIYLHSLNSWRNSLRTPLTPNTSALRNPAKLSRPLLLPPPKQEHVNGSVAPDQMTVACSLRTMMKMKHAPKAPSNPVPLAADGVNRVLLEPFAAGMSVSRFVAVLAEDLGRSVMSEVRGR